MGHDEGWLPCATPKALVGRRPKWACVCVCMRHRDCEGGACGHHCECAHWGDVLTPGSVSGPPAGRLAGSGLTQAPGSRLCVIMSPSSGYFRISPLSEEQPLPLGAGDLWVSRPSGNLGGLQGGSAGKRGVRPRARREGQDQKRAKCSGNKD